jgi:thiamine biosynthesis lipoprotein
VPEVRLQDASPRRQLAAAAAPAVASLALVLLGCRPMPPAPLEETHPPESAREVRVAMGTTAEVRVGGLDAPTLGLDAAFAEIADVEGRLSLWTGSELAALDGAGQGVVSPETFAVIRHALEVAEASDGAFDPTVEPLVRAAGGFGEPGRDLSARETRAILQRVGHQLVTLDEATRGVHLDRGARLVLDALAKGDAADRALVALRRSGATSGLVDLGGSTLAVFGAPLAVDLRDPSGESRPWGTFRLADAALGTSGGDQKPGHILDPRTGAPALAVLQASVVASGAREADALSTAVFVLGADAGLDLLVRRGAAGLVLLVEGGRRVMRTTPGFARAHALVVAPGVELRAGEDPR